MSDHWCVAYRDRVDLYRATRRYLSEGLRLGEQVGFYGWGERQPLHDSLAGLGDVDGLLRDGAARVESLETRFRVDAAPEPRSLVEFWAEATQEALASGFSGLRVVADTTPWATLDAGQRAVFLQGEQLVNRYRSDHPYTLICACNASALATEALAETAAVHPQTDAVSPAFSLYATGSASVVARGEVDALTVPTLGRVLDFLPPLDGDTLTIDAGELRFIDHGSLEALNEFAHRNRLTAVVLLGGSSTTASIVELLGLTRIRVQEHP